MSIDFNKLQQTLSDFKENHPDREQAKEHAQKYFERLCEENDESKGAIVDTLFDLLTKQKERLEDGSATFWLLWNGSFFAKKDYYKGREKEYECAARLYGQYKGKNTIDIKVIKRENLNADQKKQLLSFIPECLKKTTKDELRKELQMPEKAVQNLDPAQNITKVHDTTLPPVDINTRTVSNFAESPGAPKLSDSPSNFSVYAQQSETRQEDTSLMSLLEEASIREKDSEYQEEVIRKVQNIGTDYLICDYLSELAQKQNSIGIRVFLNAVVDVCGAEKLTTIYKLIVAGSETTDERLGEAFLEYVAQLATDPNSQFALDEFIEDLLKKGLDRSTKIFILDCCKRVSELGRDGCRRANVAEAEAAQSKTKLSDSLCGNLEEPFAALEILMVNLLQQSKPAKEVAYELMEKMGNIYKALEKVGISPVSDFKDWLNQSRIQFDPSKHRIRTEFSPSEKVQLYSLGLRSIVGSEPKKSIVYQLNGGEKE